MELGGAAFESLGLEHHELAGPGRVLVVEWAERWSDPPAADLHARFEYVAEGVNLRRLVLRSAPGRAWPGLPKAQ